ncbi:hypothetical protein L2719_12170 [Shewanella schlegeliana]|uniref:DNA repair protein n=1 Tax=Shewanella schlegeliana TaxID=190308 RepID=A0ABS1ST77_9GAMM|nr:hypothetical protein [Shewanella schlegeliana]MBL4911744.1 hypothetical protein [Shewanella schlegeliana]MCL1110304.1 hypothetical protein [Shewanella schlegeliana]GIU31504.1 hypothetical protein TUM4433_23280 [Shewanella schlegeliana]
MIFASVLILLGTLLLLVIGISIVQQQKARVEAERRNELARHRAVIDETEEVLSNTGLFPCSSDLILMLYRRVEDALTGALPIARNQSSDFERRLIDLRGQIQALQSAPKPSPAIELFRLPDSDRQILTLVQTLKKLKAILRAEHNKGKVDPSIFSQEEQRIDSLQLRINVDSMLGRGRAACFMKQYGSAKQMVTKALATLHTIKAQTPNDPFIAHKVEEAKAMLEEITGAQKSAHPVLAKSKPEDDDIDVLFQPKKKW